MAKRSYSENGSGRSRLLLWDYRFEQRAKEWAWAIVLVVFILPSLVLVLGIEAGVRAWALVVFFVVSYDWLLNGEDGDLLLDAVKIGAFRLWVYSLYALHCYWVFMFWLRYGLRDDTQRYYRRVRWRFQHWLRQHAPAVCDLCSGTTTGTFCLNHMAEGYLLLSTERVMLAIDWALDALEPTNDWEMWTTLENWLLEE